MNWSKAGRWTPALCWRTWTGTAVSKSTVHKHTSFSYSPELHLQLHNTDRTRKEFHESRMTSRSLLLYPTEGIVHDVIYRTFNLHNRKVERVSIQNSRISNRSSACTCSRVFSHTNNFTCTHIIHTLVWCKWVATKAISCFFFLLTFKGFCYRTRSPWVRFPSSRTRRYLSLHC